MVCNFDAIRNRKLITMLTGLTQIFTSRRIFRSTVEKWLLKVIYCLKIQNASRLKLIYILRKQGSGIMDVGRNMCRNYYFFMLVLYKPLSYYPYRISFRYTIIHFISIINFTFFRRSVQTNSRLACWKCSILR